MSQIAFQQPVERVKKDDRGARAGRESVRYRLTTLALAHLLLAKDLGDDIKSIFSTLT